ncbi:MAG TPA: ATP-binding protein [Flavisolibacter sp.]|nr:ATP-binding protein [Flavisolibacter sp.]
MNHHLPELILNHLLDGVLIVDKEGTILYANKTAEKLFSQPAEKLAGQSFGFPVAPGEVQQVELVKNGELATVQMLASALPWNGQDACLLSIRDITDLLKVSQELEQQKQQLESANSELEQYASLASHDLKEPLRKIMLYSEMLLEKLDTSPKTDIHKHLTKILDAAVRMRTLMNGIAEFAKTNNGSNDFTTVNLNEVVADVLTDLEMMMVEKQAKVTVGKLPTIQAVKVQMHQLFLNIISNAIKYAKPDTPPQIQIEQTQNNDGAEITITDNGIGFDSTHAEKVFQPFQRLRNVNDGGSGMGLAICKKIVEAHGGTIAVKSKAGDGSSFVFRLPVSS